VENVSKGDTVTRHDRLPVRDDVSEVMYHRRPTPYELTFGEGATHYRPFTIETCCFAGTRYLKRWFKASDDGLRYYR
jgi:hypothetical protein